MDTITPLMLDVVKCELKEVRSFVETYHYSKSVNGVKISQCFAVKSKDELVGGVIFGQMSTTAWKKFGKNEQEVLELRRLVLLDKCGHNCESRVISQCIKWIRRNVKSVKIIVSYADPHHGHLGTIYKASNFKYIGLSGKDKGFRDIETGKVYHSRALRTKYNGDFKPFVKKLREKKEQGLLEPIELPGKHCYVFELN